MIDLVKSWYRRKVAENNSHTTALTSEDKIISEASKLVTERPDDDGFVRVFGVNDREKGHLQTNQLEMIRQARKFERFDPHAHGIMGSMVSYIMGRGLSITPKDEDPMLWYVWREFWTAPRNRMILRQFEIVRRTLRDGECFIEFFDTDENKKKTGKTTIRFIDPLLVRSDAKEDIGNNNQTIRNGIVTDPEDIEKVIEYIVQDRIDENKYRRVPADRVLHIKINADSDQKRGETFLESILQSLKHYETWLENRILLNKMRTAIVMIRKVEGTGAEVAGIASTIPTASNTSANETKRRQIRGGTVITEGPGVTYRMESPNINATDVKDDGRNIKLAMAAGTNTPEYLTGDASNANFASTLIAEAPFVKAIEFWQIFFEQYFAEIYRRVIQNAVDAGLLEAPSDDEFVAQLRKIRTLGEDVAAEDGEESEPESPREKAMAELMPEGKMETPTEVFFGCDMTWPEIIHRDFKQHVEGLVLARDAGWLSDQTACSAIGYDYAEEVRKQNAIEEDAEENGNAFIDKANDGMDMQGEFDAVMKTLSPEERDKIKNGTPEEVAALLKTKTAAMSASNGAGDNGEGE